MKVLKRENRELKKSLRQLTLATGVFLRQLDETMKLPDGKDRGVAIAKLSNALEYSRDEARYFALGIDYRHDPEIIGRNQRKMPTR